MECRPPYVLCMTYVLDIQPIIVTRIKMVWHQLKTASSGSIARTLGNRYRPRSSERDNRRAVMDAWEARDEYFLKELVEWISIKRVLDSGNSSSLHLPLGGEINFSPTRE